MRLKIRLGGSIQMGYRFSLESANTVANLTFGKVMSCYRDIYSSVENYEGFMAFLDQFHRNMYSNETDNYVRAIRQIRETLYKYEDYRRPLEQVEYTDSFLFFHRDALTALHKLSAIFDRCKIKSLLLPEMKVKANHFYDFMTSRKLLKQLWQIHEGESCLILQPEESPKSASIFDAFPNFNVALRQADLWPAVIFWGKDDFAFVPVRCEDEIVFLYEIAKFERYPLGEIKRVAEKKKKKSHYIFQLSDLHFGSKNVDTAERRLKSLISKQLSTIDINDSVSFVITGDAIDTPSTAAEYDYKNFVEFIKERYGQEPIRVLGNHDINPSGLAFFHGRQQVANSLGGFPKTKILEDEKVILLLFNSNTNGRLAEGEIGIDQMAEMGNLLDEIHNIEDYLLIAVMHHHLLPIPTPEFYDKKWFEKILPTSFMDESLKLIDADLFEEWLIARNVKYVIHGHKHIPFKAEHNGITVIGCGSSTGKITHKEKGKTYISFNLLKINDQSVTCTQFVEDILGGGTHIHPEVVEH